MLEQLSHSRHAFHSFFSALELRQNDSKQLFGYEESTLESSPSNPPTTHLQVTLLFKTCQIWSRKNKMIHWQNLPARASHMNSGRFLGGEKNSKSWIKIFKDLTKISRISTFYWQEAAFLDITSINPNLQKPVESGKKGFSQENPGEIGKT